MISTPAGPPPAMRIVFAVSRLLFKSSKAVVVCSKELWNVHRGEWEVVPVAMMRES